MPTSGDWILKKCLFHSITRLQSHRNAGNSVPSLAKLQNVNLLGIGTGDKFYSTTRSGLFVCSGSQSTIRACPVGYIEQILLKESSAFHGAMVDRGSMWHVCGTSAGFRVETAEHVGPIGPKWLALRSMRRSSGAILRPPRRRRSTWDEWVGSAPGGGVAIRRGGRTASDRW